MKNYKMKKTILATSLFLLTSGVLMNTVDAQWSVIDVNSSKISDGIKAANNELKGVQQIQNIQIKQADQYQEDTDKRARLAAGVADTAKNDIAQVPTIQQCIEMTDKAAAAGSLQASFGSGGGRGANGKAVPGGKDDIQAKIVNNATAAAGVLEATVAAKACNGGMDAAIEGCSAAPAPYAGADVNSIAIKANIFGKLPDRDFNNWSMNEEGFNAAKTYARNATMYGAPPSLEADLEKVKKNPTYVSIYKPVINKLNAAYDALLGIATLRKETAATGNTVADKNWSDSKADYKVMFGMDAPAKPSFFELLQFNILRDYLGPKTNKSDSLKGDDLMQDVSRKITLSNVVALNQLKATETTNILLAHLLAQTVIPTNAEATKAEAQKTRGIKAQ